MIIGIVISSIGLSVDPGREKLGTEAERLTALLNLAGQEAVLTGTEYAAEFNSGEYRFYRWQRDQWDLLQEDVFRPRSLPDGFSFDLYLPGEPMAPSASPAADEAPLRIYLLSSGEITPFELFLKKDASRSLYTISSRQGNIVLKKETD